jgi:hypothetical protein
MHDLFAQDRRLSDPEIEAIVETIESAGGHLNAATGYERTSFQVRALAGGLPLAKRAPQRQAYRLHELARWREFTGLPLNIHPKHFPVPADDAARLIIACDLALGTEAALGLADGIAVAEFTEKDAAVLMKQILQCVNYCHSKNIVHR